MKLINEKIIDDLFGSLELKLLPQEKQNEIMMRVLELISKRAGMKIVGGFSEEEMKEFNEISKENLEEMEDFMITKNPKAKEIFQEEAEMVKEEILKEKG